MAKKKAAKKKSSKKKTKSKYEQKFGVSASFDDLLKMTFVSNKKAL